VPSAVMTIGEVCRVIELIKRKTSIVSRPRLMTLKLRSNPVHPRIAGLDGGAWVLFLEVVMQITKGKKQKPRRTLIYGVHGVGKSTLAAQAEKCLFLNLEDGLNDIDCSRSELIKDFDQIMDGLRWLAESKHDFQHVAIDTIDWLEAIIHKKVAQAAGKESIADIGYGAGYKQALTYWDRIIFALDWLRSEKGIGVILLAHAEAKKFESPETDSYDRYQPALHPLAASLLQEWCDEVLFASYRVYTRKEDQGFNKSRTLAVGDGERYLRCQETAAVLAKNRLGMPPEIDFSWAAYASYFAKPSGNIDGTVVDGSSKAEAE